MSDRRERDALATALQKTDPEPYDGTLTADAYYADFATALLRDGGVAVLDIRWEHSDHTAAKYWVMMRDSDRRAQTANLKIIDLIHERDQRSDEVDRYRAEIERARSLIFAGEHWVAYHALEAALKKGNTDD